MRIRKVLIIDPNMEWPALLEQELERARIALSGTVGYGLAGLTISSSERPELILVRVVEPVARPIQLIQQIHDALPESAIIAVLEGCKARVEGEVMDAGAIIAARGPMSAHAFAGWLHSAQAHMDARERGRHIPVAQGGRVIAIVGSKGGVGKTTIALNLAIALQQATQGSCVLVDADPLFGDVALALDTTPRSSIVDAARALEGNYDGNLREFMFQHSGIWVLAAPRNVEAGSSVTAANLASVIDSLRARHDVVLVDTAGAFSELTDVVLQAATTTLMVTTPEPMAARNAALLVRYVANLQHGTDRAHVLENRVGMRGAVADATSGLSVRWSIREDKRVFKAMQAGVPFVERYPRCGASVAVRGIADEILARGGPGSTAKSPRQFAEGLPWRRRIPA